MTKAELVNRISEKTGTEKLITLTIIESMMKEIKNSIVSNESVFLRGFGTFKPKKRAEKTGRNIKKNTAIIIPAHYIPSFKPSKAFAKDVKNNVNQTKKIKNMSGAKKKKRLKIATHKRKKRSRKNRHKNKQSVDLKNNSHEIRSNYRFKAF